MRPSRTTWILSAGAAALVAVPALADVPERRASRADLGIPFPQDVARHVAAAERTAGPQRPRLVHPLAAKPDYGSTDAGFGAARSGHTHAGQDVFAPAGTPLVAVADGVIADAGRDGGQGNYVHLYDPRRDRTYVYMHLVAPSRAKAGERVRAGQRLGGVGCTGSCWGDHLHFEVRDGRGMDGKPVDPLPLLRRWERLRD